MAGAFLTSTRRPSPGAARPLSAADTARIDADVERASHTYSCERMLLTDGLRPLAMAWYLSDVQVGLVKGGRPACRRGRDCGAPACSAFDGPRSERGLSSMLSTCSWRRLDRAWPLSNAPHLWILGCGCLLDG